MEPASRLHRMVPEPLSNLETGPNSRHAFHPARHVSAKFVLDSDSCWPSAHSDRTMRNWGNKGDSFVNIGENASPRVSEKEAAF